MFSVNFPPPNKLFIKYGHHHQHHQCGINFVCHVQCVVQNSTFPIHIALAQMPPKNSILSIVSAFVHAEACWQCVAGYILHIHHWAGLSPHATWAASLSHPTTSVDIGTGREVQMVECFLGSFYSYFFSRSPQRCDSMEATLVNGWY